MAMNSVGLMALTITLALYAAACAPTADEQPVATPKALIATPTPSSTPTQSSHQQLSGALATELANVQAAISLEASRSGPIFLPPQAWTNDLLSGAHIAGGMNLSGSLHLPGGATLTIDSYCWDAAGTVRQQSTDGGTCA